MNDSGYCASLSSQTFSRGVRADVRQYPLSYTNTDSQVYFILCVWPCIWMCGPRPCTPSLVTETLSSLPSNISVSEEVRWSMCTVYLWNFILQLQEYYQSLCKTPRKTTFPFISGTQPESCHEDGKVLESSFYDMWLITWELGKWQCWSHDHTQSYVK